MKCAIFAGGEIKDFSFIDVSDDFVICADSGYKYAKAMGIVPDIILGDFDSFTDELPENVEIYRSTPEKDDTDTMLAVKTAVLRGFTEIVLYGALGKRFDHTFANVQTLLYARENGCNMRIADADNEIMLQGEGGIYYPKRDGWYFSVFALTDTAVISEYSGVKYPLENYILKLSFPIGVSNEITADSAFLKISSGIVLVVRSKM